MGKLVYDGIEIEFNDRVLAHVQVVIGNKLRRSEGFFFSWHDSGDIGDGRSSVWLHDAIPLYFKFFGSKAPVLNREWLEILTLSANSGTGLLLSSEPEMPGASGK